MRPKTDLPFALPLPALHPTYVQGVGGAPHLNLFSHQFAPPLFEEVIEENGSLVWPTYPHTWKSDIQDEEIKLTEGFPFALYSAGVADLTLTKEPALYNRDRRRTFLMTESGGFQVGKGTSNFAGLNWNSPWQVEEVRKKLYSWIECVADASLTFDVPIWITKDRDSVFWGDKNKALYYTCDNWEFYLKHKTTNIDWINCLHGFNTDDGIWWYERVKAYPTAGWAFGSNLKFNLFNTLWITLYLRDIGALDGCRYIHFLGVMNANGAVFYSAYQRILRTRFPDIVVSYDGSKALEQAGRYGVQFVGEKPSEQAITSMEGVPVGKPRPGVKASANRRIEQMASNIVYLWHALIGARSIVRLDPIRGARFKQVEGIFIEAWESGDWERVLVDNRQPLEQYFR